MRVLRVIPNSKVLSTCSPYFRSLFASVPSHQVIFNPDANLNEWTRHEDAKKENHNVD